MAPAPASRGTVVVATAWVFWALAVISVGFRLVARLVYLKHGGGDDVAIVIALGACTALVVSTYYQVEHGLGQHVPAAPPTEVAEMLKGLFVSILTYNTALTLIKLSIIMQYLRVFVGRTMRLWCWATVGLVTLYGLETALASIFMCLPVSAFWAGGGRCLNKRFIWFFNAALNILTDLIILALPVPVLSSLRLPTRQKIGLMFVFALGGFVCLVSALRLQSLNVMSNSEDITWDNANSAIWSVIEVTTAIICASMPATKALVSRLFPRLLLSTNHSARRPTLLSQGARSQHHVHHHHRRHPTASGHSSSAPVRLVEVQGGGGDQKMGTRVEIEVGCETYGKNDIERSSLGDGDGDGDEGGGGRRTDIFVTTRMTQHVERRSEVGSEKDLITQRDEAILVHPPSNGV